MKLDNHSFLLYAITDRGWVKNHSLKEQIEEALAAGVTCLQLREKNLEKGEFLEEARQIKEITDRYRIPLIINDSVEIALAVDADGVHVGQSDMEAGKARRLLGPDKILGVSAKTVEQAMYAQACGADYLGVGALFSTSTKMDAKSVSYETLSEICNAVSIPVVAIGGITKNNIMQLNGSGIDGVAVVSSIFSSSEISKATRELLEQVKQIVGN